MGVADVGGEGEGIRMKRTDEYLGFRSPFSCLVSGPSQSGKTFFVKQVLENHDRLIDKFVQLRVLWCYGIESESTGKQMKNPSVFIKYHKGLPTDKQLEGYNTVIIDDLLTEAAKTETMTNLFTRVVHHKNVNVFVLIQNIFFKSHVIRNLNLNANYIVLFRNIRDQSQLSVFAHQFYPENSSFFKNVFKDATSTPYGYLLVDLHPKTKDEYRIRSNIFDAKEGNPASYVYKE